MARLANAHVTHRNNGMIKRLSTMNSLILLFCLGLVSILSKSDNGVRASEEQVGVLSSFWSSFFSGAFFSSFCDVLSNFTQFNTLFSAVVHISPHCGVNCPSSPSPLENKTAIGYSSFCQFPGLCSHGSSSLANAVNS